MSNIVGKILFSNLKIAIKPFSDMYLCTSTVNKLSWWYVIITIFLSKDHLRLLWRTLSSTFNQIQYFFTILSLLFLMQRLWLATLASGLHTQALAFVWSTCATTDKFLLTSDCIFCNECSNLWHWVSPLHFMC